MRIRNRHHRARRVLGLVAVAAFLIWVLVPIAVVLQNSVKPSSLVFQQPPAFFFEPTLEHFKAVLGRLGFTKLMVNSTLVAVASTALSLLIGVPAGYALARLHIRGRELVATAIIATRMIPPTALVVPIWVLFNFANLTDSIPGLVLAHTTFSLPLIIWMLRSFFEEIPLELEEAARVDGCTPFTAFLRVSLPLAAPGMAAAGILAFLASWNEFLFALVLSGRETRTVPIGVSSFIGTVSIDWGSSSAAAVLAMIPVFILGLAVQRFLVRGLTMGAVKG